MFDDMSAVYMVAGAVVAFTVFVVVSEWWGGGRALYWGWDQSDPAYVLRPSEAWEEREALAHLLEQGPDAVGEILCMPERTVVLAQRAALANAIRAGARA